jgi:hypothetical protein
VKVLDRAELVVTRQAAIDPIGDALVYVSGKSA